MFFLFFFSALLGYFDWKPGQSCLNIKTIEGERAVSGAYWLNKTGALFQVNVLSVWHLFKELNLGPIKGIACSRLRDSRVRWIEKAQTPKQNGRKPGRAGAAEPVIISPNDPFRYTSWSWYTLWLIRFDRLYQHSQSGSFLSLREMAFGVHAREIEESTITSVLNECLRDFPHMGALRKEQKTCLVNLARGKDVL